MEIEIMKVAEKVVKKLINNNETIASMESCTGGHFASTITCIDNSSKVLKFSAITYSNEYKIKMGVSSKIIEQYSVYSHETAREMSKKISEFAQSTYGIGVTGKLNKADENNKIKEDNEVFVSIYNKKSNFYIDIKLIVPKKSRKEVKNIIVDEILNKILEIL